MWSVSTTKEFDRWFAGLAEAEQVETIAKVNLLKLLGPKLSRPHADTLNGSRYANMKELRARTPDHVLRIAFALDPNRSAILLVGGDKAGVAQRLFYKQLIAKANKLYAEHLLKLKEQTNREES